MLETQLPAVVDAERSASATLHTSIGTTRSARSGQKDDAFAGALGDSGAQPLAHVGSGLGPPQPGDQVLEGVHARTRPHAPEGSRRQPCRATAQAP